MAGAKETPRQRLISLMYIVFLALLAVQVSSAIIQKFQFLNSAIEEANNESINSAERTIDAIKEAVKKNGNRSADKALLDKASELRKNTQEVYSYIEGIKQELIKETGGLEDDHTTYKGAKEEDKVAELMVGPLGSKNPGNKGFQLKNKVNSYVDFINNLSKIEIAKQKISEKQFKKIALDGNEDPVFKKDPEQRSKNFVELNFEHTPMIASLAVLSEEQSRILSYEGELLGDINAKLGGDQIKFDKIIPMYRAVSSVVAAGTKYEAEMFITASSSSLVPKMTFAGSPIKVEGNGVGKISFTASGGAYTDGLAKKTWEGTILLPRPTGDTILKVKGEYMVAEPVIDIKSAAVGALYANCGNPLTVNVPALGSLYSPSFAAEGATILNGPKKGDIFLIPATGNKQVKLKVSSSGTYIGDKVFPVKPVPKPDVKVLYGGKEVDMKNGIAAPGPRNLVLRAQPLADFAETNPKDARYKVSSWTAYLLRGSRLVQQKEAGSEMLDLTSFTSAAKPFDRIVIEIKRVDRTNFQDRTEEVKVSQTIYTVPIN